LPRKRHATGRVGRVSIDERKEKLVKRLKSAYKKIDEGVSTRLLPGEQLAGFVVACNFVEQELDVRFL
jgi:hypothetical protein